MSSQSATLWVAGSSPAGGANAQVNDMLTKADRTETARKTTYATLSEQQAAALSGLAGWAARVQDWAAQAVEQADDDYWTPEPIENEAVAEWFAAQPESRRRFAEADDTEPRWTCPNGHSCPATAGVCGLCGAARQAVDGAGCPSC